MQSLAESQAQSPAGSLGTDSSLLQLQFWIEDTGVGISDADREQIFEPFTQTRVGQRAPEGTGLGLSISRSFARLLGGDLVLTIRSDGQQGTVACLTLQAQVVKANLATEPLSRQVIAVAPGQPEFRILIADDKLENRQLLVHLLQPLGFEVQEAERGDRAVAIAHTWHPHLILMDMRMPVLSGAEAAQQIRLELGSASPQMIALTTDRIEPEQKLFDSWLRKPFEVEALLSRIAHQLGVKYLYASETAPAKGSDCAEAGSISSNLPSGVAQKTASHFVLEPLNLTPLPLAYQTSLEAATRRVDWEKLFSLLGEIREEYPDLARQLEQRIQSFEYTEILQALEAIDKTSERVT